MGTHNFFTICLLLLVKLNIWLSLIFLTFYFNNFEDSVKYQSSGGKTQNVDIERKLLDFIGLTLFEDRNHISIHFCHFHFFRK